MVSQQPTVTSGGHSGLAILVDLGGRDHVQPPHPLGMDGGDGDPPVTPTSTTGAHIPSAHPHLEVTPDAVQPRQALEALDFLLAFATLAGLAAPFHPDVGLDLRGQSWREVVGQTDGGTDRQEEERVGRRTEGQPGGQAAAQLDKGDGWANGQMDGQRDERTDGSQMEPRTNGPANGAGGRADGRTNGWTDGRTAGALTPASLRDLA